MTVCRLVGARRAAPLQVGEINHASWTDKQAYPWRHGSFFRACQQGGFLGELTMGKPGYIVLILVICAVGVSSADVRDETLLSPHDPIKVETDETLEALAKTPGSGVTGGPGVDATHPFVIENLRILHDAEPAIHIGYIRSYLVIRNVATEGLVRRSVPSKGHGLSLAHAENVTVEDCRFDKGRGVDLHMSYKCTLRRVDLNMGTFLLYDTNRCKLIECRTRDSLAQGFMIWHGKKNRFERCQATHVLREGIAFNGSAHDNEIIECVFDHCVWAGISVEGSSRIVMRGNRVSHSRGYGLVIAYDSNDLVAEGNTVTESGQDGIQVQTCRRVRIIGNTVRYSGATGIWFLASSECTTSGNVISHTKTGISVTGTYQGVSYGSPAGNLLDGNDVSLCMFGISADGKGHTIKGNNVHENRNAMVINASECTIEGNEVSDGINGIAVAGERNMVRRNRFNWMGSCINVTGSHSQVVENQLRGFCFDGITLRSGAAHCRVEKNILEASITAVAISLSNAGHNQVLDNTLREHARGVEVARQANDNVLKGNKLEDCGVGLNVLDSTGNELRQNVLTGCDVPMRIFPKWRELNTIEGNTVKEISAGAVQSEKR